jgi:hypothetical protein
VLESQEKEKKRQHLQPCLDERRHFTPFVCSVDGMLGREASTLAKRLSAKLATKWQGSHSQICGHVNARLSIAMVRAKHRTLRGSRISRPTKPDSNAPNVKMELASHSSRTSRPAFHSRSRDIPSLGVTRSWMSQLVQSSWMIAS